MDIKSFVKVAEQLPNDISVLIRGRHGIGKSQLTYYLGKQFELPVMERRLSQVTEGDMVGLPHMDEKNQSTTFLSPDWFMECVRNPYLIFLDEINRATVEVMQAGFELVLDRRIQGKKVHEKCRIYAAINQSPEYQVNELDPALLDRFYVVDLEPTIEDWIEWARPNVHPAIVDFISQNNKHLEHRDQIQPGKVYPSRRSWERLSRALCVNNLIDHPMNPVFYGVCFGLVGLEAAVAFQSFVQTIKNQMTAADVMDRLPEVKGQLEKYTADKHNSLVDKIEEYIAKNDLTENQAKNLAVYATIMPKEIMISLFTKICAHTEKMKNLMLFHKFVKDDIINAVNASLDKPAEQAK